MAILIEPNWLDFDPVNIEPFSPSSEQEAAGATAEIKDTAANWPGELLPMEGFEPLESLLALIDEGLSLVLLHP